MRRLENVALTSHAGSNTREANCRIAEAALESARRFLAGKLSGLTRVISRDTGFCILEGGGKVGYNWAHR